MKKSVMKQWVAALRSGYFKKGTGKLYNPADGSYCCLGVLSALGVVAGKCEWDPDRAIEPAFENGSEGCELTPLSIVKWAGLKLPSPRVKIDKPFEYPHRSEVALASLNDEGSSFEEIADLIEKNYKEL